MNDKIFSLWFVIIIISNVGAAFAEDADKNIWWDAKAARAKNHNKEVQKDGQVTESKEEKEQKEKKELKLLEKERKKQEREKEKRHRKKIKDEENRIKEEEKKCLMEKL